MTQITGLHAREVLDSRGRPTVEVDVYVDRKGMGRAIVPSGASTGNAEVHELRDGDQNRYDGLGVRTAVTRINAEIQPHIVGLDPTEQFEIDRRLTQLDPTPQKTRLGGNSLLGVSMAVVRAGARVQQIPLYKHFSDLYIETVRQRGLTAGSAERIDRLENPAIPIPMTNMISGGLHAGGNLDFQDFLVMPIGAPDYPTALEWIVRIYRRLGDLLSRAGFDGRLVGDEGGYGPKLDSNVHAIEFISAAIERAGLQPRTDVTIALDLAATHFFEGTQNSPAYRLKSEANLVLSSDEVIERLVRIVKDYPVTSIEDGLAEDDWDGWQRLMQAFGGTIQIVGDDLFTTNPIRLQKGINLGAANAILVKMNQIGTISETLQTITLAKQAGFRTVVSARSGETEDHTMADLAVATRADHIKIGSIARSERLAKYNRLLRIDEELRAGSKLISHSADFACFD